MTYEWYLESVHPEDRELVKSMVERAFTEDTPFSFEHRVSQPERRPRWIHGRGRVIRDDSGAPLRMLGTAQDITDRKRIEELRDSILSTVSHELRTPLTSILGFSDHARGEGRPTRRGDSVGDGHEPLSAGRASSTACSPTCSTSTA